MPGTLLTEAEIDELLAAAVVATRKGGVTAGGTFATTGMRILLLWLVDALSERSPWTS